MKNAAPLRNFQYHQSSHFDVVNGKFSAALASSNGYLFEITNIYVKNLRCKSTLNQNQFKVILIDNRMNKTYASTSITKGKLKILCKPNGFYELLYTGELLLNKQKVGVQAVLVGSVAHSRDLKTN
ncbi:MAG: hypothetical protein SGJ00_09800 [bacterium]|nr:hypothetical protein [bacterium]